MGADRLRVADERSMLGGLLRRDTLRTSTRWPRHASGRDRSRVREGGAQGLRAVRAQCWNDEYRRAPVAAQRVAIEVKESDFLALCCIALAVVGSVLSYSFDNPRAGGCFFLAAVGVRFFNREV